MRLEASGLEGIIVGKTLYKGRILLEEALKLVVST
jgi:phosphoribosylformimino-5-aminoimidazole carboxamide ribonucleotide (ProFAR) isomerase